jgi:hypothetical protein
MVFTYFPADRLPEREKLVAIACADGNAMAALGATAGQNSSSTFGLHAGAEAVRL